jgi:hypothetical protein
MLRLNRGGNSQRNPIITSIPFQYQLHIHGPDVTFKSLVIRVDDAIFTDLTSRCNADDYIVTCDVIAGVDLQSGDPPVLNTFHAVTTYRGIDVQVKRGIFITDLPDVFLTLDGYEGVTPELPTVFRPQA